MSTSVVRRDAALGAGLCEDDEESEHHSAYSNASFRLKR